MTENVLYICLCPLLTGGTFILDETIEILMIAMLLSTLVDIDQI